MDNIIKPHINTRYMLNSTSQFIDDINDKQQLFKKNNVLVSFDVESLFTNIPVKEVIDIAADLVYNSNINRPVYSKDVFKRLCEFATCGSFMYGNDMYVQIDDVSMGSPLAPTLANLFMATLD